MRRGAPRELCLRRSFLLVARVALSAHENAGDMRVGLRVDDAGAALTDSVNHARLVAAEPPGDALMLATEDLTLRVPIDRRASATGVQRNEGRRRRERLTEEGEVRAGGKVPDFVARMPAAAGGLEAVLNREGITGDANASIGECVGLHARQERGGGLTGRHLARLRSG